MFQPLPVVFVTERGEIEIEVDTERAPVSAANFLKYVDGRFYDGGVVNRAVRPDNTVRHDVEIQVIRLLMIPRAARNVPPIPLERSSATGPDPCTAGVMARWVPTPQRRRFPSSSAINRR